MAWAGWGAGPAGAGSAGGPSRWILVLLLVLCAIATVAMAATRNWLGAAMGVLATAWFLARIFLGVGRRPPDDPGQTPPAT
jgi:uncharacterized membrane protein